MGSLPDGMCPSSIASMTKREKFKIIYTFRPKWHWKLSRMSSNHWNIRFYLHFSLLYYRCSANIDEKDKILKDIIVFCKPIWFECEIDSRPTLYVRSLMAIIIIRAKVQFDFKNRRPKKNKHQLLFLFVGRFRNIICIFLLLLLLLHCYYSFEAK